jgi:2-polyprenyl-3-methyl-5-hydroxy-6-metoxy-1,4-benzoquinol methylase
MYEKLTQCPLCKSGHFNNYMVVKDHSVSQESFSVCKCADCNFLFTNPRPDRQHIGQYYESDNYISHQDAASNLTNLIYKMVRKITLKQKVRWINKASKTKGRLLDFGCGTGYFLQAAQKDGWHVVGFEPNAKALSVARDKHNLKIYQEFTELEGEKKFDAITLFHVLEHVHDLDQTMKILHQKLKQRGNLFIAVPNFNSYDSKLYKENWASLDVPRHLYHFTTGTMERLAKEHNFKIKTIKPMLFDSYYVSILSEGYIHNKNKIIDSIKNGYKSNSLAKKDNNYSSLLFILKKI